MTISSEAQHSNYYNLYINLDKSLFLILILRFYFYARSFLSDVLVEQYRFQTANMRESTMNSSKTVISTMNDK